MAFPLPSIQHQMGLRPEPGSVTCLQVGCFCRESILLLFSSLQSSETCEDFGMRLHAAGGITEGTGRTASGLSPLLTPLLEEEKVSHFASLVSSGLGRKLLVGVFPLPLKQSLRVFAQSLMASDDQICFSLEF